MALVKISKTVIEIDRSRDSLGDREIQDTDGSQSRALGVIPFVEGNVVAIDYNLGNPEAHEDQYCVMIKVLSTK